MDHFRNLSIKFKLLIPVVLLGLLMAALGIFSLVSTRQIMAASEAVSGNYTMKIEWLGDITSSYQQLRRCSHAHVLANSPEQKAALEEEIATLKTDISYASDEFEALIDSDAEMASFQEFKEGYVNYMAVYDTVIENSLKGDTEAAVDTLNNVTASLGSILTSELDNLATMNKENLQSAVFHQTEVYNQVVRFIIIMFVVGIVVLIFTIWVSQKWCVNRLGFLTNQMLEIVAAIEANQGDLTMRVRCLAKDEIGRLAMGINSFIETLQGVMGHINTSSGQLDSIVKLVSDKVSMANDNSYDISSVMEELSASMEEVASSLSNIRENITVVDDNIIELSDTSQGMYDYATGMQKRAEELEQSAVANRQNTSNVVNEIIEQLKKAIEDSKSVDRVNDLTNEILSISSQTNLLSLNASIEAARAGEAGRGFAVVADEISQLANSSKEAANNIQAINNMVVAAVNELIKNANTIVDYTNETILPDYDGFVNAGKQYNEDAVHINEIVSRFNDMSAHLKQLMESITESINGINTAVDESTNSTTNVAANTSDLVRDIGEIANAMDDNRQIAGTLTEEADRFIKI